MRSRVIVMGFYCLIICTPVQNNMHSELLLFHTCSPIKGNLAENSLVDELVSSSDLEKSSITSLAHQWMLCSEWVPSE